MLPDLEVITIRWIRDNTALALLHGGRVSANLPDDPFGQSDGGVTVTNPYITVFRVGGQPIDSEGELLIDRGLLQLDFYAPPGDFAGASEAARTFVAEAHAISMVHVSAGGPSNDGLIYYMDVVTGPRRVVEPETNWARFIVETFVTARED